MLAAVHIHGLCTPSFDHGEMAAHRALVLLTFIMPLLLLLLLLLLWPTGCA